MINIKYSKTAFITGISALALGLGVFGTSVVRASDEVKTNSMSSLVSMIASKFGLNESQVQTVFDTHRQQMQQTRLDEMNTKIDAAITAGKLTAAQAASLKSKMKEVHSVTAKTQGERKASHDELNTWATSQNIDLSSILGEFQMRGGRGRGQRPE